MFYLNNYLVREPSSKENPKNIFIDWEYWNEFANGHKTHQSTESIEIPPDKTYLQVYRQELFCTAIAYL